MLQAKCRRDKLMKSSSSVCTIKPSNSDIKQKAPQSPSSFSIISTITIVKPSESPEQESVNTTSAPKRMTRLSSGKLFDKYLCIWCMEPDESIKKKKKISQNPFYRLEQKKSWRHICACTPFLTDKEMLDRILGIIALFPKDDPFAAYIHYHERCWDKYISNISTRNRWEHVRGVTSKEVDAVFIYHVQWTVFQLNEPRTVKGLLNDYHNFLFDLRGEEKVYKTSYIKTLISEEFKDQIIFHNRYQKNESTLVFSFCERGSFLESALNSWGLPIEDLLHNVARQVNEDAKSSPQMPWPPSIANLCAEVPENFLTKFLGWLIIPRKTNTDLSPEVYAIASLLQSLVTNKRTGFQVLMTSIIYGLSRSRELVDLFKKLGFGISYQDIKNLLASWGKAETENRSCSSEIANKYPVVVVMDNDDFKMDTLTGASETNHRTNVMFVQSEDLIEHNVPDATASTLVNPKGMKDLA